MRKISIIHPSRCRPKQAFETAKKWLDNSCFEYEYILSIEPDQSAEYYNAFLGYNSRYTVLSLPNKSAIEAINNAAKKCTEDIIVVISDDFDCPAHWDTLLLNEIGDKTDFLLKTQDGIQKTLVTLPIMDKAYYNRFGYVYFPGYKHMFCDQEMTSVAIMTGKYISCDLAFPHNHYSTGKTPKDAVNERNDATWSQGERLFNERLKTNFGIKNPIIPYSEIQWR